MSLISNSDGDDPRELLSSACHGDKAALSTLLEADREYLLLLASAELDPDLQAKASPSDVVQQSVLEAHRSIHKFRGESLAQWQHWLKKILYNNIKDVRRQYIKTEKRSITKEEHRQTTSDIQRVVEDSLTPSSAAIRNEQAEWLEKQMQSLPEHYQDVLRLRFWEEASYPEIAAATDSSAEAVRKILYRAVEALADGFSDR